MQHCIQAGLCDLSPRPRAQSRPTECRADRELSGTFGLESHTAVSTTARSCCLVARLDTKQQPGVVGLQVEGAVPGRGVEDRQAQRRHHTQRAWCWSWVWWLSWSHLYTKTSFISKHLTCTMFWGTFKCTWKQSTVNVLLIPLHGRHKQARIWAKKLAIRYQYSSYYSLKHFIWQSNFFLDKVLLLLTIFFVSLSDTFVIGLTIYCNKYKYSYAYCDGPYASLPTAELCGSVWAGEIWMSREPCLNGPPYSNSGCGWW